MTTKEQRTKEQALRDAARSGAVGAWSRGRVIERSPNGVDQWSLVKLGESELPDFTADVYWRVSDQVIPFTQATVPKNALWRRDEGDTFWRTAVQYSKEHIHIGGFPEKYADLARSWEYSVNGGRDWHRACEGGEL